MSDHDDLREALRRAADRARPASDGEGRLLKDARRRRRLTAAAGALTIVMLVGGLAGATTLLGDRGGIKPAPGPEQSNGCETAGPELIVFVPDDATEEEAAAIGEELEAHQAVAGAEFVTAEQAEAEFRAANPDHEGPLSTTERMDQYRLDLQPGVDPRKDIATMRELANIGDGAYTTAAADCPRDKAERPDKVDGPLEDTIEAQGGTIRLRVEPDRNGKGNTKIVLSNETDRRIAYGHEYTLEKQASGGWTRVEAADNCRFTQELIFIAAGEEISHPIGPYNRACAVVPIPAGDYRVSKTVELESGDRLPLTVTFSVAPPGNVDVGSCDDGPRLQLKPNRASVGDRVALMGQCFTGSHYGNEKNLNRGYRIFLIAPLDENGNVTQGEGSDCELIAGARGRVRLIGEGRLRGYMVVPSEGSCFQRETQAPVSPGRYRVGLGCHTCQVGHLRVRRD